jgi:hypothetical protein
VVLLFVSVLLMAAMEALRRRSERMRRATENAT